MSNSGFGGFAVPPVPAPVPVPTVLLAVVYGFGGSTSSPSQNTFAAFGTPFSLTVVTTALADIIIEVDMCWLTALDDHIVWGLMRNGSGSPVFRTAPLRSGTAPQTYYQQAHFSYVDRARPAGSNTYEVQPGTSIVSQTITIGNNPLNSSVIDSPSSFTQGISQMRISSAANV